MCRLLPLSLVRRQGTPQTSPFKLRAPGSFFLVRHFGQSRLCGLSTKLVALQFLLVTLFLPILPEVNCSTVSMPSPRVPLVVLLEPPPQARDAAGM